ncbi:MAG: flagellar biosynthetic protein FliO [Clostridiales bacterium]|jgi:flagellar protein FliO/FliZ|nr:flagellar biosynthetic protein FliO [Clostridiales bacterium]
MHRIDIENILLTTTSPLTAPTESTNWGQASTLDMIGQFLFLIFVFAVVIALAYYSTKWLASAKTARRGGNLGLIESMSIGRQNAVALIRAGDKTMLIGITKDTVTMLSEINGDSITVPEQRPPGITPAFDKYLKKLLFKTEDVNGQNQTDNDAASDREQR